jgi:hypothetical protein
VEVGFSEKDVPLGTALLDMRRHVVNGCATEVA